MKELPYEIAIVRALANRVGTKIARKTISYCQSRRDCLHSGDDSGLRDLWDEMCVQVQYEESIFWDAFQDTLHDIVLTYVESLEDFEKAAIWLCSDAGIDWRYSDEDAREPNPFTGGDVAVCILTDYVYPEAGRWDNSRIRSFIDQSACRD